MTQQEPTGPYVYQPFGAVSDPEYASADRLWGVSGVHMLTTIKGLTKHEAYAVAATLKHCRNVATPPAQEATDDVR